MRGEKMNPPLDLSAVLANAPRNCWLALSEDQTKVVARGETVADAVAEAKKAGVNDPIVMWAPKEWISTVF